MATNFLEKKWENWQDFEKDAAEYFERLHQVFAKLDSRTVEKQNERLSTTAIRYSSELKFAYIWYGCVHYGENYTAKGRPVLLLTSTVTGARPEENGNDDSDNDVASNADGREVSKLPCTSGDVRENVCTVANKLHIVHRDTGIDAPVLTENIVYHRAAKVSG